MSVIKLYLVYAILEGTKKKNCIYYKCCNYWRLSKLDCLNVFALRSLSGSQDASLCFGRVFSAILGQADLPNNGEVNRFYMLFWLMAFSVEDYCNLWNQLAIQHLWWVNARQTIWLGHVLIYHLVLIKRVSLCTSKVIFLCVGLHEVN